MATGGQEKQPKNAPGWMGRLLGRGEPKPEYKKAQLGEDNQFVFDQKLNRWRKNGEDVSAADLPPSAPPTTGFQISAGNHSNQSRYADAGGFGKASMKTEKPNFIPRPISAPLSAVPFLPKANQTAAGGEPKFFQPATTHQAVPVWGAAKQAEPKKPSTPREEVQPPAVTTDAPAQGTPSHNSTRTPFSQDANAGLKPGEESEKFSWANWRQQDEERRQQERQNAAQLGADVMDAFERGAAPTMQATTSFTDLEDPDNSTSAQAWQASGITATEGQRDGQTGNSPPNDHSAWAQGNAPPYHPSPRAFAGQPLVSEPSAFTPDLATPSNTHPAGGDDFFGETGQGEAGPAESAGFALQGDFLDVNQGQQDGLDETWAMEGAQTAVTGEASLEIGDISSYQEQPQDSNLQTFGGGYTHSQLLEWAAYYVSEGQYTEEEASAWVDACLAQPDVVPNLDNVEAYPADMEGVLADTDRMEQELAQNGMAVTTEVQNGELHEGASASNKTAPSASGTQADEGHSGNPMSNGILPAAANELTNGLPNGVQEPMTEDRVTEGDAKEKLRQMLLAQKQQNPNFAKLTGPMPWDGVISDQEETPPGSPRAFLRANSRRTSPAPMDGEPKVTGKAPAEKPKAKAKAGAETEKQEPQNSLGAKWLDDLNKKVNSTQWIEPGRDEVSRAGSARQLFERRASSAEPCHQASSLPAIMAPRPQPSELEHDAVPRTPSMGSPGRVPVKPLAIPKPSPFQMHNELQDSRADEGIIVLGHDMASQAAVDEQAKAQDDSAQHPAKAGMEEEQGPSEIQKGKEPADENPGFAGMNGGHDTGLLDLEDALDSESHTQANGWVDDEIYMGDESAGHAHPEGLLIGGTHELHPHDLHVQEINSSLEGQADSAIGQGSPAEADPPSTDGSPLSNEVASEPEKESAHADLKAQLAKAVQECRDLEQKLDTLSADHHALMNDAQDDLDDREELQKEVLSLQERGKVLEQSKQDLERRLQEAEAAVKESANLRIKREELQENLEDMRREHQALQAKFRASLEQPKALAEASQEIEGLQRKLKQLEEDAADSKEQLEQKQAQLLAENQLLQQQLSDLEAEKSAQLRDMESLWEQVESAAEEKAGWQDRLDTLEEDRTNLSSQLNAAVIRIGDLSETEQEREALQGELQSLLQEVKILKERLATAQQLQNQLTGAKALLEEQIRSLTSQLATARSEQMEEQGKLLTQLDQLQEELLELKATTAAPAEGQSQTDAQAEETARLEQKAKAAENEVQSWQSKYENMKLKAKAALAKQKKESEEKLKDLKREKDSLQAQVSEDLHVRASELEQERDQLIAKVHIAEEMQASLAVRAGRMTELEGLCKQLKEQLESAETRYGAQEADLVEAKALAEARDGEMNKLESLLQSKTDAYERLESQLQQLTNLHREATQKVEEDEKRLTDLEAENEELFSKATAAEEEADATSGRLLAVRNELASTQQRLSEAEKGLEELKKLEAQTDSVDDTKQIEELREQLAALHLEVKQAQDGWQTARVEADSEKNKLGEAVSKLEQAKCRLAEERIQTSAAITARDKEIVELSTQLSETRERLKHSEELLVQVQENSILQQSSPDSPRVQATAADLEAQLEEKQEEMTELLACLGQEVAKIDALSELLRQQGMDGDAIQAILDEVEAKMGFEGGEERQVASDSELPYSELPATSGNTAADLSFLDDPIDAEGDWSFS